MLLAMCIAACVAASAMGCEPDMFGGCSGSCGGGESCLQMGPSCTCVDADAASQDNTSPKDVVLPFSRAIFNGLADIEDARAWSGDIVDVEALAGPLIDAGVGSFTGVSLLHKHFDLRDGEIIVEHIGKSTTFTVPVSVKHQELPCMTPYLFAIEPEAGGRLRPLEYALCEPDGYLEARYEKLLDAPPSLWPALAAVVSSRGIEGRFGISIKHRDGVAGADPKSRSVESGSPEDRWLTIRPVVAVPAPERAVFEATMGTGGGGGTDGEHFTTPTFWPAGRFADAARHSRNGRDGDNLWCAHKCGDHKQRPAGESDGGDGGGLWCAHGCGSHDSHKTGGGDDGGGLWCAHGCGSHDSHKTGGGDDGGGLWCAHGCGSHDSHKTGGGDDGGGLWCAHGCGSHDSHKTGTGGDADGSNDSDTLWCTHGCEHACGNHNSRAADETGGDTLWCAHGCGSHDVRKGTPASATKSDGDKQAGDAHYESTHCYHVCTSHSGTGGGVRGATAK